LNDLFGCVVDVGLELYLEHLLLLHCQSGLFPLVVRAAYDVKTACLIALQTLRDNIDAHLEKISNLLMAVSCRLEPNDSQPVGFLALFGLANALAIGAGADHRLGCLSQ
jgi:hypothetical protein